MPGVLVKITPEGTESYHEVKEKRPSLEQLQMLVGGYVELVKAKWEGRMREAYVDEEGLLKPNPIRNRVGAKLTSVPHLVGNLVIWVPNVKFSEYSSRGSWSDNLSN
jgi:hypothetical protein